MFICLLGFSYRCSKKGFWTISKSKQTRRARRCDSYLQSETINHWLTDRGRCILKFGSQETWHPRKQNLDSQIHKSWIPALDGSTTKSWLPVNKSLDILVLDLLVLDISCQHLENECKLQGFCVPFGQGGRSWRATGDHQISLTALAQSACLQIFATKTPYFTIANFCNISIVFFTILPTKFVIFHENRHFHVLVAENSWK